MGFIDFIVKPYFLALHQIFHGFHPMVYNMECNFRWFSDMYEVAQGQRSAASVDAKLAPCVSCR